jgi:hypothetical protein
LRIWQAANRLKVVVLVIMVHSPSPASPAQAKVINFGLGTTPPSSSAEKELNFGLSSISIAGNVASVMRKVNFGLGKASPPSSAEEEDDFGLGRNSSACDFHLPSFTPAQAKVNLGLGRTPPLSSAPVQAELDFGPLPFTSVNLGLGHKFIADDLSSSTPVEAELDFGPLPSASVNFSLSDKFVADDPSSSTPVQAEFDFGPLPSTSVNFGLGHKFVTDATSPSSSLVQAKLDFGPLPVNLGLSHNLGRNFIASNVTSSSSAPVQADLESGLLPSSSVNLGLGHKFVADDLSSSTPVQAKLNFGLLPSCSMDFSLGCNFIAGNASPSPPTPSQAATVDFEPGQTLSPSFTDTMFDFGLDRNSNTSDLHSASSTPSQAMANLGLGQTPPPSFGDGNIESEQKPSKCLVCFIHSFTAYSTWRVEVWNHSANHRCRR